MNDVSDSVRRYRSRLEDAVTRGGRARAEARERAAGFRQRTDELTEQARAGERPAGAAATGAGPRDSAAEFRDREHLPVPEFDDFPADSNVDFDVGDCTSDTNAATPGRSGSSESHSRTHGIHDEEDFSQAQMLR